MGEKVPDDRGELEAELGAGHTVFCVRAGNPKNDLHDERDRKPAHATAQSAQKPGPLPQRRIGREADLSGLAQRDEKME